MHNADPTFAVRIMLLALMLLFKPFAGLAQEKIGVLYIHHGGMEYSTTQNMWEASMQMFSYDPRHPVFTLVIWNPGQWRTVTDTDVTEFAARFIRKYNFAYPAIGDWDPFQSISDKQLQDIKDALDNNTQGFTFEYEWAGWIPSEFPDHYPYPRYLYNGQKAGGSGLIYCGEQHEDNVVLDFTNGTAPLTAGSTLSGPSGVTAKIDAVSVQSGTWAGGDAAGNLELSDNTAIVGSCYSNSEACTPAAAGYPSLGCDITDGCVGEYFHAGDFITDSGGGSATAAGQVHWADCDPERYNVDSPVERLLQKGVTKIIAVDTAVGAVRFYKPFDVVQMSKRVLDEWNAAHGTSIPLIWVNDYTSFMERSYPTEPAGWTPTGSAPTVDPSPALDDSPNPIIADPDWGLLMAEGVEAVMSAAVPDNQTGVVLFNHGLFDEDRRYFDPKIDDTTLYNAIIKDHLLDRHPAMDPDNIVGAYGGSKELNPENNLIEISRDMRGENLAQAYRHEASEEIMSEGHPWGYRYWEALDYLKNRGVQHIVIAFPQVISYSVLTIEAYNQIAKEIGTHTWIKWGTGDYVSFPMLGHPFADYWGNWVNTDCGGEECCFVMGGCGDGRPYPPARQTHIDDYLSDLDPSLAFENSAFGHLGYDPAIGPPDPNQPVQDQYDGTWELYLTPDGDPRVGQILAKHILAILKGDPPTVIELAEFSALPKNRAVRLTWRTETETNHTGFNIYRALDEAGSYSQINDSLIAAKGSPATGAEYEFVDDDVRNRTKYWYKLEDVDLSGIATMHGPVSATPRFIYFD